MMCDMGMNTHKVKSSQDALPSLGKCTSFVVITIDNRITSRGVEILRVTLQLAFFFFTRPVHLCSHSIVSQVATKLSYCGDLGHNEI